MRRSAFADLCGVSRQMISKYEGAGLVVVDGDEVDAEASLALLEGRLDETRRSRALESLGRLTGFAAPRPTKSPGSLPTSAKAQKDEVDLQIRRLQYARDAREVIDVAAAEACAAEAVAALREVMANTRRETADRICADFGLPASRAAALAKFLAQRDDAALGRFSAGMAGLAADAAQAPSAGPAAPEPAAAFV